MPKFEITKSETNRHSSVNWDKLGFGKYFTDHIFVCDYKDGVWEEGKIIPYSAMPYEPTMATLHYGQTIFEGLKAYWDTPSGNINVFRPQMNAARFNRSAERLCMPAFPEDKFIDAVHDIVHLEQAYIPKGRGESLYIRPLMFGHGNFLGVQESDTYRMMIMLSPVGSYYSDGLKPVKILVSHEFARTVRGGLGMAKTAANYAASLYAARQAKAQGFQQVLWLDGVTLRYVDEVGAMNIMFVIDNELVTPPTTQGTLLEGVIRDTVIQLAGQMGMKVNERRIKISEVYESHAQGKLQEVFGTGTAAIISPVGLLHHQGNSIEINNMEIGPVAAKLFEAITAIQNGEVEDKNNWLYRIQK